MCGFLCMYNHNIDLSNQVPTFNKMLSLLKYRGPDDYNVCNDKHVILGHCRLSIIDINGGKQPFKYTHNKIEYTIVYNGEILEPIIKKQVPPQKLSGRVVKLLEILKTLNQEKYE